VATQLATQLVDEAVAWREQAQHNAARWLRNWVNTQRNIPGDDASADTHDDREWALGLKDELTDLPDASHFEEESYIEGTDPRTGQPRRVHVIRIPGFGE
jgi:hypothetical protein